MSNRTLVILGAGGFGREVLWAAREQSAKNFKDKIGDVYTDFYFADDDPEKQGTLIDGVKVIGKIENLFWSLGSRLHITDFICGVGSPAARKKIIARLNETFTTKPPSFATIIHPSVNMSEYVKVGEGSVICAGSILTTGISVGKHVNINIDITVGHDTTIEDFVNISPGVHLSGYVYLQEGCDIGTGANIVPHITVGEGSIVAAGATVIKDVPKHTLVAGVPAQVKKEL